jgi:signal transduction histidine kinase
MTTLRQQWDALRRLDQFRRESVSNLSHDLRSPLTATVACLETLQRRWDKDAARADDQALVQVALRNSRNAAQLVRSLGDLALLDEPTYKLQRLTLDVGEMLDDIAMRFADRAAQRGISLRHDVPDGRACFASVDAELLERAIANLVDNAMRFTAPGGHIVLLSVPEGDRIRIEVSDDGSGVDAQSLPHLFDRLYSRRSEQASGAPEGGGSGLGLAIVRRIVDLHQGEIRIDSAVGHGTRVSLWLPAVAAAATAAPR